jgi:hypothetical protein
MLLVLASGFACEPVQVALNWARSIPYFHDRTISQPIRRSHYTGKSRSSLRRFVEAITKPDNHPDRQFILPTIEEVNQLHSDNHPFSWRISTQLLDQKFNKQGSHATDFAGKGESQPNEKVVSLLEETISMLNRELDQKNKQIAEFQERQRETNILLKQTTERLVMLSEGSKPQPTQPNNTITVDNQATEEGSPSQPKQAKQTKPRQSKPSTGGKSLWERLNIRIF